MNKSFQEQVSHFTNLIETSGVEWTAENVLKCIGFAHEAMRNGECSVEAYYYAKTVLLQKVECANEWIN